MAESHLIQQLVKSIPLQEIKNLENLWDGSFGPLFAYVNQENTSP